MSSRHSRNVALTPEWDAFIEQQLAAGEYGNASELFRAGLRALRDGQAVPPVLSGWPIDGGECGRIVRGIDWAANPMGPVAQWSMELRATVANIVNSPVAKVLMWGPDHIMIYNDAYMAIAGAKHPAALGGAVSQVWPEIWDFNSRIIKAVLQGERPSYRNEPLVLDRGDGPETIYFDLYYTPVYDRDGRIGGVMCTCVDNTVRRAIEHRLSHSNRRFDTAMQAMHGVLWTNSADGQMLGEQPAWSALTGQSFEEYQGYGWANAVHPDDAQPTIDAWQQAVAAKGMFVFEHRVRRHDGVWRSFAIRGLPLLDDRGEIIEWVGVHTDITHQRAAEATLREQADNLAAQVRHRERAEAQLRQLNETLEARVIAEIEQRRTAEAKLVQAQKMETIGKLTGGVAHDFNNLLQVVSGNLQLLAKDIAGNDRAEQRVANAMAGVSRGAKLASQLLAFGRRQALEPKVVNVTRLVRGMDDMLRRAIGEGVEIETVVGGGLWNTFIDPAQIENALLNLAINARDAMNGQGKLTIELGNAHLDADYAASHDEVVPGQYVMMAVSDTGSGISAEVMEKVFEPFFSTKSEGKGSGLGLSMVYGFVKQSGGHVKIYSEVGEGTTVRLYLPRAMASEDVEVGIDHGPLTGGTETVLVVEDDDEVRATVVEMLTDLGYRVLKAPDASAALIVIESGVPIDILFTDVVMPGPLKSPELARMARERLPNIAVLFTSGYTENSIVHGGKLDAGVELLSKPYTREALARRFRHVLNNSRQQATGGISYTAPRPAESRTTIAGATVLLVEDDELIRMNTADVLQDAGCVVVDAGSGEEAMTALQTTPVDVMITDLNLPGMSGAQLASKARDLRGSMAIVFATGDGVGAEDATNPGDIILVKPYDARRLTDAVASALRARGVRATGRPDEMETKEILRETDSTD